MDRTATCDEEIRKEKTAVKRMLVGSAMVFVFAACSPNSGSGSNTVSPSRTGGGDSVPDTSQVFTYFDRYTSDRLGQIQLTGILDIQAFGTVNLEIDAGYPDQARNLTIEVSMGKISGETFAESIDRFTLDFRRFERSRIHTYDVIGPDLTVWILGAPPHMDVDVQAWVFLH